MTDLAAVPARRLRASMRAAPWTLAQKRPRGRAAAAAQPRRPNRRPPPAAARLPEPPRGRNRSSSSCGEMAALRLAGIVDIAAVIERLTKETAQLDSETAKIDAKLHNPDFLARAPEEVVGRAARAATRWPPGEDRGGAEAAQGGGVGQAPRSEIRVDLAFDAGI